VLTLRFYRISRPCRNSNDTGFHHCSRSLGSLAVPMLSQNRFSRFTFSFLGRGCCPKSPLWSTQLLIFSLLLKRQTSTPTLASSLFLDLISEALRSSQTRSPSFSLSLSNCLFLPTNAPETPLPQTKSPDLRSTLQHSFGSMLADTRVDSLGRRSNDLLSRIQTSDQCKRRAARCVFERYIVETGGWSVCNAGLRGSRYFTRSW